MAKRREWAGDERRLKAEHGGVGTPHSRGASGMIIGSGAGEVGSFSWHSRAWRLVGSVTQRRGDSSAHRPSGRDPGTGVTSQRAIGPPSRGGGSDAQAELRRIQAFLLITVSLSKVITKKRFLVRGCGVVRCGGLSERLRRRVNQSHKTQK